MLMLPLLGVVRANTKYSSAAKERRALNAENAMPETV